MHSFLLEPFFYENVRVKLLKIEEHAKNILRARKGEELLFWILHENMEIICLSADARRVQCCKEPL